MPQGCYHNTPFFVIYKWPNKLECYIAFSWIGLPGANTLAYWAHVSQEEKSGEYSPCTIKIAAII